MSLTSLALMMVMMKVMIMIRMVEMALFFFGIGLRPFRGTGDLLLEFVGRS
jgi:hypothetical protein